MRRVVVTGMGMVTPLGSGVDHNWSQIIAGKSGISRIEGVVESTTGPVQGARVVLQKAPVIQHVVTVSGDLLSSRIPAGLVDTTKFFIDGQRSPRLEFRRGEIHRFEYEPSAKGYPITFIPPRTASPPRWS